MARPMQSVMRVKLLELALTIFENFQIIKETGCNYYFHHLLTHNDKVRHELISDFWSCMNEGLIIPLDNEKDQESGKKSLIHTQMVTLLFVFPN